MSRTIARQLLSDARRGVISKDALLQVCLKRLEDISDEELYRLALDEGFIHIGRQDPEDPFEAELKELDATQRIIEKVLSRHGE